MTTLQDILGVNLRALAAGAIAGTTLATLELAILSICATAVKESLRRGHPNLHHRNSISAAICAHRSSFVGITLLAASIAINVSPVLAVFQALMGGSDHSLTESPGRAMLQLVFLILNIIALAGCAVWATMILRAETIAHSGSAGSGNFRGNYMQDSRLWMAFVGVLFFQVTFYLHVPS